MSLPSVLKLMHAHVLHHVQFVVTHTLQSARLLCPCVSPGENTGVGGHFILQRIFLTQGSNPCPLSLLYCRQILHCLATGETSSEPSAHMKYKEK